MLRTTITKFKKACSVARVPRILRGDVWSPASNFEKLSAILMTKYKSTTTGSNDDEDQKCKKCKQIIDLAFGPDKPEAEDRIEDLKAKSITQMVTSDEAKSKVVMCEKGNKILTEEAQNSIHNILNATKVQDEEKAVEASDYSPNEEKRREKCEQLIELVFGPDRPKSYENIDNPHSKTPVLDTENVAQMFVNQKTSDVTNIKDEEKLVQRIDDLKDSTLVNKNENICGMKRADDIEKLHKKVEIKPLVVPEINIKRKMPFKHFNTKRVERRHVNERNNIFEELAARCIDSHSDKNDSKLLKEMKKLDITEPCLEGFSTKSSDKAQKSEELKPKIELEPSQLLEKGNLKKSRRNYVNRRAMKHLTLPGTESTSTTDHTKDVTLNDNKGMFYSKVNKDDFTAKASMEKTCTNERVILLDIDSEKTSYQPDTVSDNVVQTKVNKLDLERTELQHDPLLNCKQSETYSSGILIKEVRASKRLKKKSRIDTPNVIKNESIINSELNTSEVQNKNNLNESIINLKEDTAPSVEPAVLVKESDDPGDFRITPHTPKAETLSDRLNALNVKVKKSVAMSEPFELAEAKKKDALLSNAADRFKQRILNDEKIPLHLFADLTVISKNLPEGSGAGKAFNDLYEQNLEKETTLIKPERLQYYSHNDEIVEFGDSTREVDPHVVIREYEDDSDHTGSDPNPNYYSNYYNNQGNMGNLYNRDNNNQNYMPSDSNGMPQNVNYNHGMMTNTITPSHNMWNAVTGVLPVRREVITGNTLNSYYYNSSENMYHRKNINQNNMTANNSLMPQNMTYNTWNAGAHGGNMWNGVTANNLIRGYTTSENNNASNDHKPNASTTSAYNSDKVLIDPYGKNRRTENWEESEIANPSSRYNVQGSSTSIINHDNLKDNSRDIRHENERPGNPNIPIDPLLTSRFIVNGSESNSDHNTPKVNKTVQQIHKAPISNHWIDKGTVATSSIRCNAYVEAQEPVKISQMPVVCPKEKNMTLSEMLRRVRERARLEMYREDVMLAASVTEVNPTKGKCKEPKPPCPPPQKTCPPTPPKCPPSNCPEPKPPCPKPCKPACPDPCATPKCPPAPKKDPCAKFVNHKTLDMMGLVVSLSTHLNNIESKSIRLIDDILCKLNTITDSVIIPEIDDKILEDYEEAELIDNLFESAFYFPRDYEPWTPIPSWPIPSKQVRKKIVCPQEGCKVRPPPPPGSRCNNIHHPCAGFPNEKKRT